MYCLVVTYTTLLIITFLRLLLFSFFRMNKKFSYIDVKSDPVKLTPTAAMAMAPSHRSHPSNASHTSTSTDMSDISVRTFSGEADLGIERLELESDEEVVGLVIGEEDMEL